MCVCVCVCVCARFEEISQFHMCVLDLGRCVSSVYNAC